MTLLLVTVLLAIAASFSVPTSACACVDPMPDKELRALIRLADQGDIRATGQVWQEYALVREDRRNAKLWASRAIRAGDPDTMESMADDWMWEGQRAVETRHKLVFYDAALRLLENGYRNRRLLPTCGGAGLNDRYFYVANIRRARAALATARNGPDVWIQRANKGSSSAAYHLANHYFWVELDQTKRGQWERRASELGDPMFAGNIVLGRPASEDIRDILYALGKKPEIAKLGDAWVQDAVTADLRDRLARTRHFASGKTGKFSGGSCKTA
ncbi:hypothetical protein AN936_17445 [Sphingopyxis macrogoltabida]|uniref:Sel1 repeat family protein n=2 Tax=Sphingopyxis macrogoltabida TaxID=33050 RepID=A0A0N9V085_SPHMC|nr:hypothetical protein AN936_17445 [Sphingopyxis macrogoltabida]